jgi:hypothetical protein
LLSNEIRVISKDILITISREERGADDDQ